MIQFVIATGKMRILYVTLLDKDGNPHIQQVGYPCNGGLGMKDLSKSLGIPRRKFFVALAVLLNNSKHSLTNMDERSIFKNLRNVSQLYMTLKLASLQVTLRIKPRMRIVITLNVIRECPMRETPNKLQHVMESSRMSNFHFYASFALLTMMPYQRNRRNPHTSSKVVRHLTLE